MTNNEAIEILNLHNPFMTNKTILSEAMDVAVKSLKNSNDTAIKTLEEILEEIDDMSGCDNLKPIEDIFEIIYAKLSELKGETK